MRNAEQACVRGGGSKYGSQGPALCRLDSCFSSTVVCLRRACSARHKLSRETYTGDKGPQQRLKRIYSRACRGMHGSARARGASPPVRARERDPVRAPRSQCGCTCGRRTRLDARIRLIAASPSPVRALNGPGRPGQLIRNRRSRRRPPGWGGWTPPARGSLCVSELMATPAHSCSYARLFLLFTLEECVYLCACARAGVCHVRAHARVPHCACIFTRDCACYVPACASAYNAPS